MSSKNPPTRRPRPATRTSLPRTRAASVPPDKTATDKDPDRTCTRSVSLPRKMWDRVDRERKAQQRSRSNFFNCLLAEYYGKVEPAPAGD